MKSSLGNRLGQTPRNEADLRAMAAAVWHKRGVVVLFPDQILGWVERGLIEAAACKLYGPRRSEQDADQPRRR